MCRCPGEAHTFNILPLIFPNPSTIQTAMPTTLLTVHDLRLLLAQEEGDESGCNVTFADGRCSAECQMNSNESIDYSQSDEESSSDIEQAGDQDIGTT